MSDSDPNSKPIGKDEVQEGGTDAALPPRLPRNIVTRAIRKFLVHGFLPLLWTVAWVGIIAAMWMGFATHVIIDAAKWGWSLWPIW